MSNELRDKFPDVVISRIRGDVIKIDAINKDDIEKYESDFDLSNLSNAYFSATINTCEKATVETLERLGYKKREWINVNDRLPECFREVLTFCRGGINILHLAINGPDVKGKHCIMWAGGLPVSHWMPLPEPPNE